MTTDVAAGDVQPVAFVTVYVYVPAASPLIVVVVVEPVIFPGLIVQLPAGKPDKTILPVATLHVGCVTVPTVGALGAPGTGLITTLPDAADVQPAAFVTV